MVKAHTWLISNSQKTWRQCQSFTKRKLSTLSSTVWWYLKLARVRLGDDQKYCNAKNNCGSFKFVFFYHNINLEHINPNGISKTNIYLYINSKNNCDNLKSIYLNGNNLVQSNKIQWDIRLAQPILFEIKTSEIIW